MCRLQASRHYAHMCRDTEQGVGVCEIFQWSSFQRFLPLGRCTAVPGEMSSICMTKAKTMCLSKSPFPCVPSRAPFQLHAGTASTCSYTQRCYLSPQTHLETLGVLGCGPKIQMKACWSQWESFHEMLQGLLWISFALCKAEPVE